MTVGQVYKIITANRLADGAVVYRRVNGDWSQLVAEAELVQDEQAAAELLAAAENDVARAIVVAPYIIDVARDKNDLAPVTLRERIRAAGPTIQAF